MPTPENDHVSPPKPPASHAGFWRVALAVAVGMSGLLVIGLVPRWHRQAELAQAQHHARHDAVTVNVVQPHAGLASDTLVLPGEIRPYQETAIYARTNGYLKRRLVDIGDRVRAGQLLAEIESPELDRELGQAQANLAQSQANLLQVKSDLGLARTTLQRWQALSKSGDVARQEVDEKQAAYTAKQAALTAGEANVRAARTNTQRMETLQAFERVTAPFAGTITARGLDIGALITAGTAGTTGSLFKLSETARLRIDIRVPQTFANSIYAGQPAQVIIREIGTPARGVVARTAGALDPASRTLLAQVQLDNANHAVLPGMYGQVRLEAKAALPTLMIPGNTLITGKTGVQVAVVGASGKIHFQQVKLGRDTGTEVEILDGLTGGESVIVNPSDDVKEGAAAIAVPLPVESAK